MKDGTFGSAEGWCDYTGWDCQSGVEFKSGFDTVLEAIDSLDCQESGRPFIRKCLEGQVLGSVPYAIYQEDNV
jgi:hypothetical protein